MAQAQNPSIAAASPTYYPPHSPYGGPPPNLEHHGGHYAGPSYAPWPGYNPPSHMYSSPPSAAAPTPPPRPGQQVYSFVPIPGAQQQKRPRRRFEEIDRMYRCGHGSCEKAYGTLNHLNAHVTMQSHGQKRTPEEFKDIRKEWKSRRKAEAESRKDEAESRRVDSGPEAQLAGATSSPDSANTPTTQYPPRPQLPPLSYTNGTAGAPAYSSADWNSQNGTTQVYSTYPHAPYNSSPQVYPRP